MTTMTHTRVVVTVGVDTHRDNHVAAALDAQGRPLGTTSLPASAFGYRGLLSWAEAFGAIDAVGIEGTGSWGAGLCRYLMARGVTCVEVTRPNRQHRRRHGKSDTADAIAAARAVQSGEATATPRGHNSAIEGLRTNRVAHRSAVKARTQAINQLKSLVVSAPDQLRRRFQHLCTKAMITAAAQLRPSEHLDAVSTTKHAMRSLARRVQCLDDEITELANQRQRLIDHVAPPQLTEQLGVGPHVAADLLIAYSDNPHRVTTEAAFAALCGASPIDASSGRQQRHRLNRGGDRHANNALWRITMTRLSCDPTTQAFLAHSTARGKTKRETIRILKRHIARRIWRILNQHPPTTH